MKTNAWKSGFLLCAILFSLTFSGTSQGYIAPGISIPDDKGDLTSSPFFYVDSNDEGIDRLPLKSTDAHVRIAGVIADVNIIQVYKNEGKKTLEALYVFPASTRAAVYGMRMVIGERTIVAKIEKKEKAWQDYEQAKQDGKTASLLEQQRPNVFQMNVANILPGDEIRVELSYTELIVPDKGVYEFVYPTVVGPRYTGKEGITGEGWAANPYTQEGVKPLYTFRIELALNSAVPIHEIRCTSHTVDIHYADRFSATVGLAENDGSGGNRDFILQYRLAGDKIESGIMLFNGREENFFLAMVQPPRYVTPEAISPREYVFIMDVSGSMYGYPLEISKKLMKDLIGSLRPQDRFNVLLFAGDSRLMSERSLPASHENIQKATRMIEEQNGGGGTEILPALQRALALDGSEDYTRTFIIATDGYVTVEREVFDLIRRNLGRANFFPFGIGTSVNRYIIEGLAHTGMGIPFVATSAAEAEEMAKRFRKYVQFPVLSKIMMRYNGFDVYDVEPLSVPDVFSERPVLLFGKYRGAPAGSIELSGQTGHSTYHETLRVDASKEKQDNQALAYLWARERIRTFDDYAGLGENHTLAESITTLGLRYNLLTRYTSFIAIDSEAQNQGGELVTVEQPLPLPEGVSNYAIGGISMGTAAGSWEKGNGRIGSAVGNMTGRIWNGKSPSFEKDIVVEYEPGPESTDGNVFTVAEQPPVFGWLGLSLEEFFEQNIQYPWAAVALGTNGVVYVTFVVEKDGSVSDVRVIRGIGGGCDEEAVRLVRLTSSFWTPAFQGGLPVRMQMTVPVKFGNK